MGSISGYTPALDSDAPIDVSGLDATKSIFKDGWEACRDSSWWQHVPLHLRELFENHRAMLPASCITDVPLAEGPPATKDDILGAFDVFQRVAAEVFSCEDICVVVADRYSEPQDCPDARNEMVDLIEVQLACATEINTLTIKALKTILEGFAIVKKFVDCLNSYTRAPNISQNITSALEIINRLKRTKAFYAAAVQALEALPDSDAGSDFDTESAEDTYTPL